MALKPGEAWHCCLLYTLADGDRHLASPTDCVEHSHKSRHAETMADWLANVVKIRTSNEEFYRLFRQALEDMAALRLPMAGTDHMVFLPAAGLPWFVAPFGRDSLIVSLQNTLIYPEFARGTLEVLGALQAKEAGRLPRRRARQDTARNALRRTCAFQADSAHALLRHRRRHAAVSDCACMPPGARPATGRSWSGISRRPKDACPGSTSMAIATATGFQEYQTRSPVGYENMGWKDSGDSVVYPDGSLVKGPKALCELQGYVYDAWVRMAEVFDALGKPDRAQALRAKAAHFSSGSTKPSGTKSSASMPMRSTARRRRC